MATATKPQSQPTSQPKTLDEARSIVDQIIANSGQYNAKARVVHDSLMHRIPAIEEVLPDNLKGQGTRLVKRAVITFNRTPDLQNCPPDVFVRCVIQAAELGLSIDGRLCYVVRYKNEYQVQADYKGLVAVAKRTGQIVDCKADVVYANDNFRFRHANGQDELSHVPELKKDRGQVIAAYASFVLPGNQFRCYVMTRAELDKVRNMAPAKNGPWASWTEEMMKKCPVRRGLKMYCDDPGMLAALELDADDNPPPERDDSPLPTGTMDLRTAEKDKPAPVPAPPTTPQEPSGFTPEEIAAIEAEQMGYAHEGDSGERKTRLFEELPNRNNDGQKQ